ncbi:hypothetical protein BaRGS_00038124 [Batillaria attramentaria]|uniref:Uncharacterized protein n=1 Tax=Batillaria attramentaria TaxID=370345 RepID=A0ABD0J7K5_9CAEN
MRYITKQQQGPFLGGNVHKTVWPNIELEESDADDRDTTHLILESICAATLRQSKLTKCQFLSYDKRIVLHAASPPNPRIQAPNCGKASGAEAAMQQININTNVM